MNPDMLLFMWVTPICIVLLLAIVGIFSILIDATVGRWDRELEEDEDFWNFR